MMARLQFGGAHEDRGFYTALGLLLVAVLAPTACLLYFINEAIDTQRNLSRQQLSDAYRGQLRLMAERIDSYWEQRSGELDQMTEAESPALFFEHCVRDGIADSAICLRSDGKPAYPSLAAVPQPDPAVADPKWAEARMLEDAGQKAAAAERYESIAAGETDLSKAARAAQAAIRCLMTGGRRDDALRKIEEYVREGRLMWAAGLDGRIIMADEYRLAMQLLPASDRRLPAAIQRLYSIVQNYSRPMPSAQRLFLMDYLRMVAQETRYRTFPTYQSERLAERILSSGHAVPGGARFELTGIGDMWKLTSKSRRVIGLYATDTIMRETRAQLDALRLPGKAAIALTPPGRPLPPHIEAMALSGSVPWWISVAPVAGVEWNSGAGRRAASYLWIGFLTIATMGVAALAAGQLLRRQMRIAHLKTDLAAAVSHELKTPLASMNLLVESLLSSAEFEPQRTREYLQMVARENSRLSRLIDNFLTFSRMERGRGKFQFERVRPEAVARAALESIGDRYSVELDQQAHLPPLYADEDALVTALLNLLDNAYKYTGDDRRIVLRVRGAEGRVCFSVQDNGIGISEKDQKKIFRRFFQVDRRLARQAGGVGLGLSIVEYIVKAHHGEVTVASSPGAGSTFSVWLAPSTSGAKAAA